MDNIHPGDLKREQYQRTYRKAHRADLNRQNREYYQAHPEARWKRAARKKVDTEVRAGRLKKLPCQICGEPKVQAHHADYSKPLEVQWFCAKHHGNHAKRPSYIREV